MFLLLNFSDADVPFFLVCVDPNSLATVKHIKDWETCQSDGNKVCLYNSSSYLECIMGFCY